MSELDEVLSGEDYEDWVDEALQRVQPVSNATLAGLDFSTGFDDVLAHIWEADATGGQGKRHGRRRRVVVTGHCWVPVVSQLRWVPAAH